MGLKTAPNYIGESGFLTPVENDRQLIKRIFSSRQGVLGAGDFLVSQAVSGLAVAVAGGAAVMGDKEGVTQGFYFAWSDASENVAIPGPSGSPRIDALILRIVDTQYGASSDPTGAHWEVVAGTPASSPVAPADSVINDVSHNEPGAWLRIADIRVNPTDTTSIPAARITDRRVFSGGGMTLAASEAALPLTGVAQGGFGFTLDLKRLYVWNGTAWQRYISADDIGLGIVARTTFAGSTPGNAFGTTSIQLPSITISNFVFKANRRYRVEFFGSHRTTNAAINGVLYAIVDGSGVALDTTGANAGGWYPNLTISNTGQGFTRSCEVRYTVDTTKSININAQAAGGAFVVTERHTLQITDLGKIA